MGARIERNVNESHFSIHAKFTISNSRNFSHPSVASESLVRELFFQTLSVADIVTDYERYAALTMSKAQESTVFQIAGVCFDKSSSFFSCPEGSQ